VKSRKYPWVPNIDKILNAAVPCPLCNGEGDLLRVGNQKEFWIYECAHCGVPVYDSGEASITPMKAVCRWNDYVNSYKRMMKMFKCNTYLMSYIYLKNLQRKGYTHISDEVSE